MLAMNEYQKYEDDCKKIRAVNDDLLKGFEAWLASLGLAPKTIVQHVGNIDFFINQYLLYEDAIEAIDGPSHVGMYFSYWFISKATWASPGSVKSSAASIKKFYSFMVSKGLVTQDDLKMLAQTIKDNMPIWLAQLRHYDQEMSDLDDDY